MSIAGSKIDEYRRVMVDEYGLPEYMVAGVYNYVENKIKPGGFMTMVLMNKPIFGIYAKADSNNKERMDRWVIFIYNHLPGNCWGTEDVVNKWLGCDES